MKRIVLITAIGLFCTWTSFGQDEKTEKGELPNDLLIKLSSNSRNRPPGGSYAITLKHDGTWFYEGFRGYHIGRFTGPELGRANEARLKKVGLSGGKMPVDRLSKADLIELLDEFQALDFFNLNARYSFGQVDPETGKPMGCETHAREETIYIRSDGREKSVENFTGCFSNTSKKLTALGEKILLKLNLR